ncbi:MAG: glycosyl transferase, group 1 [Gemmatimonadetes bacterium]|nr:glycosyl transferase, group 1 [Gemmatimonadota bacterium]
MARLLAEVTALAGEAAAPRLVAVQPRIGVVCDFAEEGWPSMDLAAELLLDALAASTDFRPSRIRPPMPRPFGGLPSTVAGGARHNADRAFGRYVAYPRWLRGRAGHADLFHVVDHSYAHLVHALPADRTVVTCHDLDAFRSLLDPALEPRGWLFRAATGRVLSGLRRAARVVFDSAAVRDEAVARGVVDADRSRVVPLPVHPDFSADSDVSADARAAEMLGPRDGSIDILHVGSTAPRKRIDVLLAAFAAIRAAQPTARLLRVGGALTVEQARTAEGLGIGGSIVELAPLDRPTLAAVYRRAAIVLLPSDREGFGLPLVEAMACGTPVLASDLPVLREVGGPAAEYAPAGDADAFAAAALRMLAASAGSPAAEVRRRRSVDRAATFRLDAYGDAIRAVYAEVLRG